MDNITLDENSSFSNSYRDDSIIEIQATPYTGYAVDYLEVNGERVYSDFITLDQSMGDQIDVSVHAVRLQDSLTIDEVYASGDSDYIVLKNTGENDIWLPYFYLSDKQDNLFKYCLPDAILEPGQTVTINCKNNSVGLANYLCNFNLTEGENLYLTDETGSVIDEIAILNLEKGTIINRDERGNLKYELESD